MTSLVSGLDPVILDEQFEETYHVKCTLCDEYCSVLFSGVSTKQTNKQTFPFYACRDLPVVHK
jgi:hypothetical protein